MQSTSSFVEIRYRKRRICRIENTKYTKQVDQLYQADRWSSSKLSWSHVLVSHWEAGKRVGQVQIRQLSWNNLFYARFEGQECV